MYGNQVPVIELSFIDNFSWKKLLLSLTREIAGLEQEEYMYENCRDNKYFLINLDNEVRNNDSITKIWLCKVMSEKRGWQVTKSPTLNPPLVSLYVLGKMVMTDVSQYVESCSPIIKTLHLYSHHAYGHQTWQCVSPHEAEDI